MCTSKRMTNDQTEVSTHAIFTYLYVSVPNKSKMKLKRVLFHPFEKYWRSCGGGAVPSDDNDADRKIDRKP